MCEVGALLSKTVIKGKNNYSVACWYDQPNCQHAPSRFFKLRGAALLLLVRSTLTGLQAEEQLSAVGKRHVFADPSSGPVLGPIALYHDLGPGGKGFLREPESVQIVRAAAFDHPSGYLAIVAFNVHVNPGVRIRYFPFDDGSLQLQRFVLVEFRRKCVMAPR